MKEDTSPIPPHDTSYPKISLSNSPSGHLRISHLYREFRLVIVCRSYGRNARYSQDGLHLRFVLRHWAWDAYRGREKEREKGQREKGRDVEGGGRGREVREQINDVISIVVLVECHWLCGYRFDDDEMQFAKEAVV